MGSLEASERMFTLIGENTSDSLLSWKNQAQIDLFNMISVMYVKSISMMCWPLLDRIALLYFYTAKNIYNKYRRTLVYIVMKNLGIGNKKWEIQWVEELWGAANIQLEDSYLNYTISEFHKSDLNEYTHMNVSRTLLV